MMREVKAFYEQTADKRVKGGAMTLEQASAKLEPIADALVIVGVVELAVAMANEPGLDETVEYADLAKGLAETLGAGPKSVAKENAEACGDCRVPRCRFCDQPGERAGGRKDGSGRTVERYYICKTAGCISAKMATPLPMGLFSGGK